MRAALSFRNGVALAAVVALSVFVLVEAAPLSNGANQRQANELNTSPLTVLKKDMDTIGEVVNTIKTNIGTAWDKVVNHKDEGHFMAVAMSELRKFKRHLERHLEQQETNLDELAKLKPKRNNDEDETNNAHKIYEEFRERAVMMYPSEDVRRDSLESIAKRTTRLVKSVLMEDVEELAILLLQTMHGADVSQTDLKANLLFRVQTKLMNYLVGVLVDVMSCIFGQELDTPEGFDQSDARIAAAISSPRLELACPTAGPRVKLNDFVETVKKSGGDDYSWMLHGMID